MSAPNNLPTTIGLSPKFIIPTIVTTVLSVLFAVVIWVQDNIELLGMSPVWSGLLVAALFPIGVALSAYNARPGNVVNGPGPVEPGAHGNVFDA